MNRKLIVPLFLALSFLLANCYKKTVTETKELGYSEINTENFEGIAPEIIEPEIPEPEIQEPEIPKDTIPEHEEGKKYLYLTFDDGPNAGTSNLLKSLNKYQIPATIFIVGRHANTTHFRPYFLEVGGNPLFQLANHSYSHANNRYKTFYSNSQGVLSDFNRVKEDSLMKDVTISRTPGRNSWRMDSIRAQDFKAIIPPCDLLFDNGFQLIGWDVEWKHHKEKGVKESAEEMMRIIDYAFDHGNAKTKNHVVLLTHDQYFVKDYAAKELDKFFEMLNNRPDIILRRMNHYPGVRPDKRSF